MSGDELERSVAADMPLSEEDAEAVVGGAIVHTYNLPNQTITVDQYYNAGWKYTFKSGTTIMTSTEAKAAVTGAGQEWIPTSTWRRPPPGFY